MLPVRSNILVDWATCLFSKLFIAGIGMMVAHTIPPPTITKTATVAMMRLTSSHWGMLRKIIFIRLKRRRGAAIYSLYCILFCWYLLYGPPRLPRELQPRRARDKCVTAMAIA